MTKPASFRDVIALWPSPAAMAETIGASVASVRKWAQRDSIPSEWWSSVTGTAKARDAGVDAALLAELAARDLALRSAGATT